MSTYKDHHALARKPSAPNGFVTICVHSWPEHTARNLAWSYGEERAARIIAGQDPKTQADIARWQALGRRSAA